MAKSNALRMKIMENQLMEVDDRLKDLDLNVTGIATGQLKTKTNVSLYEAC
ncbi:hypothetical protein CASFOL_006220 [Castilleja foliolosa]|uniref:Uncharacterized protein n=1 Tax=Castilleja foliolosa TaxID=1961234 RepID=A0ABD3E6P6_9LAMI